MNSKKIILVAILCFTSYQANAYIFQDAVNAVSVCIGLSKPTIDASTQDILMNKKDELRTVRKSFVSTGTMHSPSISLSGCLDVANIVALKQATFASKGLIKNSLSNELTFIHGDFIITKSTFHGTTHIAKEALVVSYNSCLLDQICIHSKDMILDLRDTVVTGDIIFDHPGIIVIDKKTVLSGTISNARVMIAKD